MALMISRSTDCLPACPLVARHLLAEEIVSVPVFRCPDTEKIPEAVSVSAFQHS